MRNLTNKLSQIGKNGIFRATVISVSGSIATVKIGNSGSPITVTKIAGPTPTVGSTVNLDISSGSPVILSTDTNPSDQLTLSTRTKVYQESTAGSSHSHDENYLLHIMLSKTTH